MHLASKLDQLEKRFDELTQQMADPAIISDSDQYRKVTKAQSELSDIVAKYREWKKVEDSLSQARPRGWPGPRGRHRTSCNRRALHTLRRPRPGAESRDPTSRPGQPTAGTWWP